MERNGPKYHLQHPGILQISFRTAQLYKILYPKDEGQVSVTVPDDFDSNIRIKAFAHGFTDTVKDDKALFVDGKILECIFLLDNLKFFFSLDEPLQQGR